ncbi:MAG: precorrin-3B C(17)-methyltransferase [Omnitrophica bacterium]|nr:precorrin-3B C(17)-methyltransferase [Candidatus Omnitrophota bacterium]
MRATGWKKNKANLVQGKSRQGYRGRCPGKLYIIGIGPGDISLISPKALEAIKRSEVVVGYKTYIGLLGDLIAGKEVVSSGMTQEAKRAGFAIKAAEEGRQVSLISSGDPGIYGMAGLVLELLGGEEKDKIRIEIIPGIIAATSCASLLGAPLMHDFAVISLSDILTDLKLIKRRIVKAASGDFVIVFYNPQSKSRTRPLKAAWKILMKYKSPNTPVGMVRNAARKNQEVKITTLKDMLTEKKIDMVTTIIVGNSRTFTKRQYMITPRGYNSKVAQWD